MTTKPSKAQIKKMRAEQHNGIYNATGELSRIRTRLARDAQLDEEALKTINAEQSKKETIHGQS